jgi:hypothetical protein
MKAKQVRETYKDQRAREVEAMMAPNYCHKCGQLMSHHLDKTQTSYIGCPNNAARRN